MKRLITLFLVLLMIGGTFGVMAGANKNESTTEDLNLNIAPDKTFKDPKMESAIVYINMVKVGNPTRMQCGINANEIDFIDDKIRVVLELIDDEPSTLSSLEEYGITIEATYKNLVQVLIPISKLKSISENPSVRYIRMPLRSSPNAITSEGVATIGADKLHDIGIRGNDVKIAIIDGGFKGYKRNLEIPIANLIEAKSFRADRDIEAGEVHGAACAEVVLDVAPDAGLYLLNFDTGVEFANAVDYAIEKDVNIISCSMAWVNAGGYDGTGFICDIANHAHENGILFVNSAGNYAERHYEGIYNDTDGDNWHEFSINPKDELIDLGYIEAGAPITLFLSWDDWPYSNQDYDLYLFNYTGVMETKPIAWSTNYQTGTQPPREGIVGYAPDSNYYYVAIGNYSATRDVHFELYSFHNYFPEYNVSSSSLSQPADAVGVMAVGATYWKDDSLEYFSSRGPTNDGRLKPDVTAPDGMSNSVYALSTGNHDADLSAGISFFGTSASAPHTAGAAALLLSANSSLTANDLQSLLESTAVDLGTPGKDNLYGSGRIDVYNASQPKGSE
jgi:subtilisin family serine protease